MKEISGPGRVVARDNMPRDSNHFLPMLSVGMLLLEDSPSIPAPRTAMHSCNWSPAARSIQALVAFFLEEASVFFQRGLSFTFLVGTLSSAVQNAADLGTLGLRGFAGDFFFRATSPPSFITRDFFSSTYASILGQSPLNLSERVFSPTSRLTHGMLFGIMISAVLLSGNVPSLDTMWMSWSSFA